MSKRNFLTLMEKIDYCLDDVIKNIEPSYKRKIIRKCLEDKTLSNNIQMGLLLNYIKKRFFDFDGPYTQQSRKYWLKRKWPEELIEEKRIKFENKSSPYTKEFWIKRGYTEEQAEIERLSRVSASPYFYMKKLGCTYEEALEKALEHQKDAYKIYEKNTTKQERLEKQRQGSGRCKEYWIKRGYTEKEAIEKVKERQATFTLEKCIKKYGEEKGRKKWEDRQKRWQETLNNKTDEEKERINKEKGTVVSFKKFIQKYGEKEGRKRYIKACKKRNVQLFKNANELIDYIKELKEKNIFIQNLTLDQFIQKHIIRKDCYRFLGLNERFFLQINFTFPEENEIFTFIRNKHGANKYLLYHLYTPEGKLLKSSNEINFYYLLIQNGINEFSISGGYKDSNLFYDFYLNKYDLYIEIAGRMNDEEYRQHMIYKQTTFGSIIICSKEEQFEFIKGLLNGNYEKFINRNL